MKKILGIITLSLLLSLSAFAESLTCVDTNTNKRYKVLYNSEQIKAFGKTFDEIFVSSNSILGTHTNWKKALFGKKIDETWNFFLSFDGLSRLTVGKFVNGKYEWTLEKYYNCN